MPFRNVPLKALKVGKTGTPLTMEPPPGRAHAGELDHARGEHEAEEEPTQQPDADLVVGIVWEAPGRAQAQGALEHAQGGHQDAQEANLQQKDVPACRVPASSIENSLYPVEAALKREMLYDGSP